MRCRVNFPRFVREFEGCIVSDFAQYYAVARSFSKVTARQYRQVCERIGAPLSPAPEEVRRLFDPFLVEEVFATTEFAFDAAKLREVLRARLQETGVEFRCRTEAETVKQVAGPLLEVRSRGPAGEEVVTAAKVLNCTYSGLNRLLAASRLPLIPLKHELTEMAVVEVPPALRRCGITVMCGPFFSVMPFPPLGLHTIHHVRYTPHCEWRDRDGAAGPDPYAYFDFAPRKTRYPHMVRDVRRYVPLLGECRHVDSIWELKTVLPKSEVDDSRPVLYREDCGLPNLTALMGGKIDNVYDILEFSAAGLG